jgi:hypothetical protein
MEANERGARRRSPIRAISRILPMSGILLIRHCQCPLYLSLVLSIVVSPNVSPIFLERIKRADLP